MKNANWKFIDLLMPLDKLPSDGMQIWSLKFKDMPMDQILDSIRAKEEWQPYGYNHLILCRYTSTIYLYKR